VHGRVEVDNLCKSNTNNSHKGDGVASGSGIKGWVKLNPVTIWQHQ